MSSVVRKSERQEDGKSGGPKDRKMENLVTKTFISL